MKKVVLIMAFVVLTSGIWCALTDNYPMTKAFRPSWYEYGWPFCFATAGRSHFNFTSVSWPLFCIDVFACLAILVLSLTSINRIYGFARFTVRHLFSVVFAASIAFCFCFNHIGFIFEFAGFDLSRFELADRVGEFRPLNAFPPLVSFILGSSVFLSALAIVNRLVFDDNETKDERNGDRHNNLTDVAGSPMEETLER